MFDGCTEDILYNYLENISRTRRRAFAQSVEVVFIFFQVVVFP